MRRVRPLLLAISATLLGGCQTGEGEAPAVLQDEEAVAAARTVLAQARGQAQVRLGLPDPREEPVLVVLPPPLSPLENRSVAQPVVYDIALGATGCFLRSREDGTRIALEGVTCRRYEG